MDVLQHSEPKPKPAGGNMWRTLKRPERRHSIATEKRLQRKKEERKKAVKDYLLGLFPPLEWVPLYFTSHPKADLESQGSVAKIANGFPLDSWKQRLRADVIAGIQVAMMVVPQSLSYAQLAQLPLVIGLYSTLMGMFIYTFFGTSRELSVAPVAVNALLVASTLSPLADPVTQPDLYLQYVILTTFLIGIFSLGFGLLNLGYAVTFVSPAVILGFTSGSAVTILVSQLETLFGYSTEKSDYAIITLVRFFAGLPRTKWVALLLGLISLAIMEGLKRIKKARLVPRPLVVVIVATLSAYLFQRFAPQFPVPIVGTVPRGLPPITIPRLSDTAMLANAVVPAFLLTIIGFLQSIAVSLRFSEKRGYLLRPSQELNALGISHIVSSFFSSFDATGGFSRTAVSASVGTVSQFSSLVTTLGTLISLLALAPLFYYLPKSALAAIIISAVIPLIDPEAYVRLWKVGQKIDMFVGLGTAAVTFFVTAQIGIGVGVGVSLLGILYVISRPHFAVLGRVGGVRGVDLGEEEGEAEEEKKEEEGEQGIALEPVAVSETVDGEPAEVGVAVRTPKPTTTTLAPSTAVSTIPTWRNVTRYTTTTPPGILVFRFDARIWFANAVYFRERCLRLVARPDEFGYPEEWRTRFLVLDFSAINSIDDAGFVSLVSLKSTLQESHGVKLLLAAVKGPVRDVLWRSTKGFTEGGLAKDVFFGDVEGAVNWAEGEMAKTGEPVEQN